MSLFALLRFLLRFSRRLPLSWARLALALFCGLASGVASAGFIAVINRVLGEPAAARQQLPLFVALVLVLPACRFVSNLILLDQSERALLAVRLDLAAKILAAPLSRLEKRGSQRLLAVLTEDVNKLVGACVDLPELLMNLALAAGLLGYMVWLSWQVFLVVLVVVAVGSLSFQLPMLRAQGHFRRWREIWDEVFAGLKGVVEGTKELKLNNARRREFLDGRLREASERLRATSVRANTLYFAANSWGQVLAFLLVGVVLFVLADWTGFDRGTLTGFTLAILYLVTPLDILMNRLPALGRAEIAAASIEALGISLDELGAEHEPRSWGPEPRRIELRQVEHHYQEQGTGRNFQLGPLDLVIERGDLVFLVGGNGSGKTTLGKVLCGLYPPLRGTIEVDGVALDEAALASYRQLFSAVFSDFFLFDALYGVEASGLDERARRELGRLGLADKVSVEGGRFSTLAVSQGQKRRLALVAALLEDRPILLFDEWAAEQDTVAKEWFYRQLLPELRSRGKTVLVISHDDRFYDQADRIVKLEDGRIVSQWVRERQETAP